MILQTTYLMIVMLLEKQICYFSSTIAAESKVVDNKAFKKEPIQLFKVTVQSNE